MPSPWDDKQKPKEKSKHHGKRDHQHNEKERGLGGRIPPGQAKKAGIDDPDAEETVVDVAAGAVLAGLPSYFYVSNKPPITDQGMTSRCVAHASASDQWQHDRPEFNDLAKLNFNIPEFANRIGTTSAGAFISVANDERRDRGYPVIGLGDAIKHQIRRAEQLEETIRAVKAALSLNHGVLMLLPWFHSWFHTLASGKLPWPDYHVGYHEIYCDGWNDNLGFALRNSWGKEYGLSGRCYLPYTHLWRAVVIHRTVDK